MDLQTENQIASMLLEEARNLRAQAEKEGIQAYLNKPNVRARPNSRFLTATVLNVQQANRAVEVNEMWRAREKEKELENKQNRVKSKEIERRNYSESSKGNSNSRIDAACSSRIYDSNSNSNFDSYSNSDEDRGFGDDEIEEFLRSRRKRGRGDIGSRMDEPGPYLSSVDRNDEPNLGFKERKNDEPDLGFKERKIVGPQKPSFLNAKSSEKKDKWGSKDKRDKKKRKEKREEKKRKKEKKSKGHHHKRRREYDD